MPQSSFNISRLISRLGLKNIIEMPVRGDIQATIPLTTMYGQVPVHVAGSALAGGVGPSAVGEYTAFELQCLDAGGLVLNWTYSDIMAIRISETPLVWLSGPTNLPLQHFSSEPSASLCRMGTMAAISWNVYPPVTLNCSVSDFAPLYVPRGSFVQMWTGTANQSRRVTFCITGISATEAEA